MPATRHDDGDLRVASACSRPGVPIRRRHQGSYQSGSRCLTGRNASSCRPPVCRLAAPDDGVDAWSRPLFPPPSSWPAEVDVLPLQLVAFQQPTHVVLLSGLRLKLERRIWNRIYLIVGLAETEATLVSMGRVVVRVSDEKRKVDSLGAGEFMSESQHLAANALFLPGRTDDNGCDSGSGDSFAQQSHRDGCQSRSIRTRFASSALPRRGSRRYQWQIHRRRFHFECRFPPTLPSFE